MHGTRNTLRWEPLTAAHVQAVMGMDFDFPYHGLAFFWCGKLAGFGGVALCAGQWVAFSDIAKDVTVPDIAVWRCAKLVMKEVVRTMEGPVFAGVAPSSVKWATLLGFQAMHMGELFVWVRD